VRQYALDVAGDEPRATLVRDVKLASQTEGCVADDRTGLLYVAEEDHAIWRMPAAPDSSVAPEMFAAVDGVRLIPDVEGLAIVPRGDTAGFLLASSQADDAPSVGNAYVAYDLDSGRFVERFRVIGSGEVDGTSDTDGIEFASGDFGAPFEQGILVVQDGDNAPDNQNFKMVPGSAVRALLERTGTD
jgi:3-phytase